MNNKIPRSFKKIICKMRINTNGDKVGDIVYITKEDNRYFHFNTRTEKLYQCNLTMIKNSECVEFLEVVKYQ